MTHVTLDRLPRCAPEEQGLDPAVLDAMYMHLARQVLGLRRLGIVRGGCMVGAKRFRPLGQAVWLNLLRTVFPPLARRMMGGDYMRDPFNTYSITKSVVSLLVGRALADGVIPSLDTPVADFFGADLPGDFANEKRAITPRHLLAMTSGLRAPEQGQALLEWTRSGDWTRAYLSQPLDFTPGAHFEYSTASYHLMSAVLQKATGEKTGALARRWLFDPLGIGEAQWQSSPEGVTSGGSGLCLSAEDLAKIAALVLARGRWQGEQVIPAAWIEQSTARVSETGGGWYGLGWWSRDIALPGGSSAAVTYASGSGGQRVFLIPALDLAMVALSEPSLARGREEVIDAVVEEYLVRAAAGGERGSSGD